MKTDARNNMLIGVYDLAFSLVIEEVEEKRLSDKEFRARGRTIYVNLENAINDGYIPGTLDLIMALTGEVGDPGLMVLEFFQEQLAGYLEEKEGKKNRVGYAETYLSHKFGGKKPEDPSPEFRMIDGHDSKQYWLGIVQHLKEMIEDGYLERIEDDTEPL